MWHYLTNAVSLYIIGWQSGVSHLDNNACMLYATGWLMNWLDERR